MHTSVSFNRTWFYAAIVALMLPLYSCSSGTNPPTTDPNKMQFKAGSSATFMEYQLDTTNAQGQGGDTPIASTMDTVDITTLQTGLTYKGMSNVVSFMKMSRKMPASMQTEYVMQDTAYNVFVYNFGLSQFANNPLVKQYLGDSASLGWLLAAKMKLAAGTQFTSVDTSLDITVQGFPLTLLINGTGVMGSDTTIKLANGSSITARHVMHTITISSQVTSTITVINIDLYVTPSLGTIGASIIHNTKASISALGTNLGSSKITRQEDVMISHN